MLDNDFDTKIVKPYKRNIKNEQLTKAIQEINNLAQFITVEITFQHTCIFPVTGFFYQF